MQNIQLENLQHSTSAVVSELFHLIQDEPSPFAISKRGKKALDDLCSTMPHLKQYQELIAKNLSIRILQKCKNYYRNMKMSKLKAMLHFYSSEVEVERLLYECNRSELILTTISYHSGAKGEGSLTFKPEAQVAENLSHFGKQL